MHRRKFFKQVCQVAAVAVVAPHVLIEPVDRGVYMSVLTIGKFNPGEGYYIVDEYPPLTLCDPKQSEVLVIRQYGESYGRR